MQIHHVYVHKANGFGEQETDEVVLAMRERLPKTLSLDESRKLYEADAVKIVDALQKSLPGGTFDWVMAVMMQRKASHFVHAWEKFSDTVPVPT
jgi:hypothetical protein